MKIHIDDLEVFCIIGLLDFERELEQKIVIKLTIDYEYQEGIFLNYTDIVNTVEANLKNKRYKLLETALLETKELLFKVFPVIKALKIKISKPDILSNCSVGLSGSWTNIPR